MYLVLCDIFKKRFNLRNMKENKYFETVPFLDIFWKPNENKLKNAKIYNFMIFYN